MSGCFRYAVRIIPIRCPDVSEISVRMPPKYAEEYNNFITLCILPIIKAFESALNRDYLLESEKDSFYFGADAKELLKGNILKRYQAYEIAINSGFMTWDEIRDREDLEAYGLKFIKLGLQDVLYNVETKEIYTPNTNKTNNMDNLDTEKGGE